MKLLVNLRNVYGNETIYPACEKSHLLAEFKKQKTFTSLDVKLLKQLGYTFELTTNNTKEI